MVLHKKGGRIFKFSILVYFDMLTLVENVSNNRTDFKEAKITAIKDKRRFVSQWHVHHLCNKKEISRDHMEHHVPTLVKIEKMVERYERTFARDVTEKNVLFHDYS